MIWKNINLIDLSKIENWPPSLKNAYNLEDREGIFESLIGKSLKAWHCTKLVTPDMVIENGLKTLSPEMYEEIIMSELQKHLSSIDFDNYLKAHKVFIAKGYYENRQKMIWFILNKEMSFHENGGCHDFFKFYGGEVTRRIVEFRMPHLMNTLQKLGKAYLVEFEIGFDELPEHRKSFVTQHFLEWKRRKEILEIEPIFESEAYVDFDIPKEKILNLIPLELYLRESSY